MGLFSRNLKIKQGITVENLKAIKQGMSAKEAIAHIGEPQFVMESAAAFAMMGAIPEWAKGKENWVYKTPYGEFQLIVQDKKTVAEVQFINSVIEKLSGKALERDTQSSMEPSSPPGNAQPSRIAGLAQTTSGARQPAKQHAAKTEPAESGRDFAVVIDEVVSKQGRGTYVKGVVAGASICLGDSAYIVKAGGDAIPTKINDIRDDVESSAGIRNEAKIGAAVAFLLRGIVTGDVAKGDVLSASEVPTALRGAMHPVPEV